MVLIGRFLLSLYVGRMTVYFSLEDMDWNSTDDRIDRN